MAAASLFDLAVVLVGAKLGGEAAARLRFPPVLGELTAGLLLSAGLLGGLLGLPDLGVPGPRVDVLEAFAAFGAVLLLFEVGLDTHLRELRKVGASAALVALLGIGASFAVGFAASWGLAQAWPTWSAADAALPPSLLHVFVGATLTATSVGITARVLRDLGTLRSPEARIVLGAAVLDDIGGLLVLAAVAAAVSADASSGPFDVAALAVDLGIALAFLVVAVAAGRWAVPKACDAMADRFQTRLVPMVMAVAFACALAWAADRAGLADIVGAFVAGLVLAEARHAPQIATQLRPLAAVVVGLFFVVLGMRIDVTEAFGRLGAVLVVGLALTLVAVAGKLVAGLGVVRRQADRLVVGVGMVPRGEVGLVFAGFGLSAGLVANWQYSALLLMVVLTTALAPFWLARLAPRFTPDAQEAQPPSSPP